MSLLGIIASQNYPRSVNFLSFIDIGTYTRGVIAKGNDIYLVGQLASTTLFYTANVSSAGAIEWQRTLDSGGTDNSFSVNVDSSDNVYMFGQGGGDASIVKYNSTGTIQWQNKLATAGNDRYLNSYIDSSNNIFTVGYENGGTALLVKYDTAGTISFKKKFNLTTGAVVSGVDTDSSGNIYISGYYDGAQKAFLLKVNSTGATVSFTRSFTGSGEGQFSEVRLDSTDANAYVGFTQNAGGTRRSGVAKYNSSGTLQWQRQVNIASGNAHRITIDSSDNVYAIADDGEYVFKYNSSGTLQWQRRFTGTTIAFSNIYHNDGKLYITGLLDSNGALFVIPDDGSLTGTYTLGVYTITYAAGALTDSAGGGTDSSVTFTSSDSTATASATTYTDAAATNSITKVNI